MNELVAFLEPCVSQRASVVLALFTMWPVFSTEGSWGIGEGQGLRSVTALGMGQGRGGVTKTTVLCQDSGPLMPFAAHGFALLSREQANRALVKAFLRLQNAAKKRVFLLRPPNWSRLEPYY